MSQHQQATMKRQQPTNEKVPIIPITTTATNKSRNNKQFEKGIKKSSANILCQHFVAIIAVLLRQRQFNAHE